MKNVLELNHNEAKSFFLKEECYFNFDLPQYFSFQGLLDKVSAKINGKSHVEFYVNFDNVKRKGLEPFPSQFEDVNYTLLNNKDGKYAWRPFQLIHPAIYVALVNNITEEKNWKIILERFSILRSNPKIECFSIPIKSENDLSDKATTVNNWWHSIEQHSIELALNYEYVLHTDITDCYGSLYTHSIAWALHSRTATKTNKSLLLVGNAIDKYIRDMSFGQTNGIPQGSILMDFVAEMVLGYADLKLTKKLSEKGITDYHIIRYRDDYRIFSNNPQISEQVARYLTEILIVLGMRLNAQKTFISNNLIRDSIKPDKLYWVSAKKGAKGLQTHLLLIHELSQKFPNSGSLSTALTKYFNRIQGITETKEDIKVLISIIVDISYKNPRTYAITAAILSKLFTLIDNEDQRDRILNDIQTRFDKIPNTGILKIWLQRITIKFNRAKIYDEKLCNKVNDGSIIIWNSDWLNDELKTIINSEPFISEKIIESINSIVNASEVQLFELKSSY